jgi:hypothetical protein
MVRVWRGPVLAGIADRFRLGLQLTPPSGRILSLLENKMHSPKKRRPLFNDISDSGVWWPTSASLGEGAAALQASQFLSYARACVALAEQAEDWAVRDHLLMLVRAWLAAAKQAEDAAS